MTSKATVEKNMNLPSMLIDSTDFTLVLFIHGRREDDIGVFDPTINNNNFKMARMERVFMERRQI